MNGVDAAAQEGDIGRMMRPGNQIQRLLDAAGVPWRRPDAAPRLTGLLPEVVGTPIYAFPRSLPAIRIEARSWSGRTFVRNEWRSSVEGVQRNVSAYLGPPQTMDVAGRLHRVWTDMGGSIVITAQTTPDEDDPNGPRTCLVEIRPGWRKGITAAEAEILRDMTVFGRGTQRGVRAQTSAQPTMEDAPFLREPGPEAATLDAALGFHAPSDTLIACPGRLLMIPLSSIVRVGTHGIGDGVAMMVAHLSEGSVVIAEHEEVHGLDLVWRAMDRAIGHRFEDRAATS